MTERIQMPPHRNNHSDGFVISDEAQEFLNKGAIIIRMRGLPYECSPKQVIDFFREGDQSCEVYDGEDGILFVKKPDGKSTGDAFVQFVNESEAAKALSKHKENIGTRYIELFRSTPAEVEQVLRKSQETRPRVPVQMPLVAPIAPPPVLLPQQVITSGTRKDCIRLRGLPYEAQVQQILDFLGSHSKSIVLQGVHMVYKAHGQPSGEAFIQMDSEASAALAARQCHNNEMHCGKKVRYVEVFQCSGDDMNAFLNSGHLPPRPTVMNPAGIDNNIPGMGLPLAPTMLPYYEPSSHFPMMPFIQNPFLLNQIALQQQQNALAASLINESPQKQLYQIAQTAYPQWPSEMDHYKPSTTTTTTTTTDSLTKPKMSEAEIIPHQQDLYSTYGSHPGVYYLPRVIPNPMFAKSGYPTVQPPYIFPQVTQTLPAMGVLGVKRSWEQAFPLETAAAIQGAKRWQTPQVASFPTPGFFPDVG